MRNKETTMPSHLKSGVRARMATTGESYQEALRQFRALLTVGRRRNKSNAEIVYRRSPAQRSAA
jgi:hypothetical protein